MRRDFWNIARPQLRRLTLCLLLAMLSPEPTKAQRPRVVVLIATGLSSREIGGHELPVLERLVGRSAVGWMNARTARVSGRETASVPRAASYLTVGAGGRATATPEAATGTLDRLRAANAQLDHAVSLGALGDLLHGAGITTGVVGADDGDAPDHSARLLAIDAAGRIDLDRTDAAAWAVRDVREPYGLCTSVAALACAHPADFDVRVFGDLGRAQRYAPLCVPAMARRHRAAALVRLNAAVEDAARALDRGAFLILISPAPPEDGDPVDRLAPILVSGPGIQPGMITSGSTHTPGLVSSTDLLPEVAAILHLPMPPRLVGRPMTSNGRAVTPAEWATLHDRWVARARQQSAIGGLAGPQAGIAVVALAILLWWPRRRPLAAIGLGLLALPGLELLLPLAVPSSLVGAFAALIGAMIVIAAIGSLRPGSAATLAGWFAAVTTVAVAIDTATGSRLDQNAWASYTVMEGGRYYGIGNEYAGVLLACSVAAFASTATRSRRAWVGVSVALFAATAIVGLPQLGANAGGFLGCGLGFAAALMVWRRGRLTPRDGLIAMAAALVGVLLLFAADLLRGAAGQTHFARTLMGGGGDLWESAARKVAMNAYLLVHSTWSAALLCAVGLFAVAVRRARQSGLPAMRERALAGAATGLAVGVAALFALNDSGVLAAAHALLPACGWWLSLAEVDSGIIQGRLSRTEEQSGEATSE